MTSSIWHYLSRRPGEQGSALMLVPAGVLILMVLAAIAIDSSIAFMAQREMLNDAAGVANDAVTAAIPEDELQRAEAARPDPVLVDRMVQRRLVGQSVAGYRLEPGDISTNVIDDVVTVTIKADIDYVFAKAIPGARHQAHPVATASAQVRFAEAL